ncbi:MAG: pimeloyl-ACP methyl ester carboxylesterase [Porticoccaceae bacterium]
MKELCRTESANLDNLNLTYDEFGSQHHTPIILIHGLGTQRIGWPDDFCILLADKGFRVIRFDNRDIGQSSRLDKLGKPNILWLMLKDKLNLSVNSPYTLQDMAKDTIALLDHLEIEKAHIVGASMGGMIAQRIAAHYPQRTLTLVSVMSSSGKRDLPGPAKEVQAHLMSSPQGQTAQDFVQHELKFWKLISSKRYPPNSETLGTFIQASVDRGRPYKGGPDRQLAAIIADGSREELLRTIIVPTLVIHGDEDPLLPVECGLDTAVQIPDCEFELVKGMAHDLPVPLYDYLTDRITKHGLNHMRKNLTSIEEAK